MAEIYVEAAAWIVQTSTFDGMPEKAEKTGAAGAALAQKILALRPGNKRAISAQAVIATNLANVAVDAMRPAEALEKARRALVMQQMLVSMDPGSTVARNNYAAAMSGVSDSLWSAGRVRESLEAWEQATDSMRKAAVGAARFKIGKLSYLSNLGRRRAESGDFASLPKIQAEMVEDTRMLRASSPVDSPMPNSAQGMVINLAARVAFMRGDAREALRLSRERLPLIDVMKIVGADEGDRDIALFNTNDIAASAALELGDAAAAEKYIRISLEARKRMQLGANWDAMEQDLASCKLGLTLLAQNRRDEAARIMEPVVKRRREVQSRNHGDNDVRTALATALYVQGLIDVRGREVLLSEAATLVSAAPKEYRNLFWTRYLLDHISEAQLGVMPWKTHTR
jgi:tetratricopeptide (TPR) repeat protein